jgi:hypothetical protein
MPLEFSGSAATATRRNVQPEAEAVVHFRQGLALLPNQISGRSMKNCDIQHGADSRHGEQRGAFWGMF